MEISYFRGFWLSETVVFPVVLPLSLPVSVVGMAVGRVWTRNPRVLDPMSAGAGVYFSPRVFGFGDPKLGGSGAGLIFFPRVTHGAPKFIYSPTNKGPAQETQMLNPNIKMHSTQTPKPEPHRAAPTPV